MDKQTKQLAVLGGLVVIGGLVAAWQFGLFGGGEPEKPKTDPAAAAGTPTPTAPGGEPAPTTPSNPGGAQGVPGGPAPQTQDVDLDIPEPVVIPMPRYRWQWDNGGWEWENKPDIDRKSLAYDPLWVQNIDVVDPKRKEYIDNLKQEWVLDGLSETMQRVQTKDAEGNITEEDRPVLEAWFRGKKRPYGEKDRLTNTRFTIEKIFKNRVYQSEGSSDFKVRSGVDLAGDTGAKLTIFVGDDGRYAPENK
ncbi:MAG: hypothetical protein H6839_10010 [Planctomycetes bacterium]|nr:hypothetical protein [Planctomycetota bacterium]